MTEPRGSSLWLHVKSGALYTIVGVAIDATNIANAGRRMVIYQRGDGSMYARELSEFMDGRFREWTGGL